VRGIDTNVLIRYLTNDDPERSPLAHALVIDAERTGQPLWIGFGVVLETLWVLERRYRVPRTVSVSVVDRLLHHPAFKLESPSVMEEFCRLSPQVKTELGDLLLGIAAEHNACDTVLTFDKLASKNPLYSLLR